MKRQHYRDYSTAAFMFYARSGGYEKYLQYLLDDMRRQLRNSTFSNPTESLLIHKDMILRSRAAEFADIEAVEKTLLILGRDENKAVEFVYFKDCWKELEKGDIEARVHSAEIRIPASYAQIYRWLAKARKIFAQERGLRI